MKVLVNKCPDTGELFESDSKYKAHRQVILREKRAKEKFEKEKDVAMAWLDAERMKITKVEMIAPWIRENQKVLMEMTNKYGWRHFSFSDKFVEGDFFEKFEITGLRYSDSVSNTHCCPRDGVTNWGGRVEGAPRGYPGWTGRVEGKTVRPRTKQSNYPSSGLCNFVGVYTGTGGGGNDHWGYSVEIFLSDWPGLIQEWADMMFEKEVQRYEDNAIRIVKRLSGNRWA